MKKHATRCAASLTAALSFAFAAGAAGAANLAWTGNASNLWSDARNWHPASVPKDGDVLTFGRGNQFVVNDLVGLALRASIASTAL